MHGSMATKHIHKIEYKWCSLIIIAKYQVSAYLHLHSTPPIYIFLEMHFVSQLQGLRKTKINVHEGISVYQCIQSSASINMPFPLGKR